MSLQLTTPKAYPVFLTKNYFSADSNLHGGDFYVSSNVNLGPRLYDMDPFAYWVSSGSSEGATEAIRCQLYEGFSNVSRAVGLFALLNTNLKAFKAYYSTDAGVNWNLIVDVSANAATNYVFDMSAVPTTMNAFLLLATNTIGAVAEKQVGTIVLAGVQLQLARAPDRIKRRYFDAARVVQLADYSEDITYVKRSPASHEFYGCDIYLTYLSDSDRDALRTIRRTSPNFCLYPEPGSRPGDLFYGRFTNDWEDEETILYKSQGNTTVLSFKEISS